MDQETPNPPDELVPLDMTPITRIGVETELSKYPVHSLAKKGKVDIQIVRKRGDGQIELKWEVSYNDRYGQARQLAYKLDTLVVNRRIDEEGRPLPKLIKLGSLRDIAEILDLGANTNKVRRALRQNVGTLISAKLRYRSLDGSQRTLEADFTRYSAVFTGEKLPDGREADAVYIVLNEPYWEVLNNAPIRPLNYDYLKALPPAAQRFYEIISGRLYAALKNKNPFARIPYSEFCTYSALTRHADYENFRVQMAKIHRPHLKSGYIAKVHFEEMPDGEGKRDWMMCYGPGPRARAEYMTFSRKTKRLEAQAELAESQARQAAAEQVFEADFVPASDEQAPSPQDDLLDELLKRGVVAAKARKVLSGLAENQHVLDQLEWGDFLIRSQPEQFRNPAGFYVYLLTGNVIPPPTFESSRQQRLRQEAQQADQARYMERQQLEAEYDDYRWQEVDRYIRENLSEAEVRALTEAKRKQIASQFKNLALMSPENIDRILRGALKAEIAPRVPFLAFNEYCAQRSRQPGLFESPVEPETSAAAPPDSVLRPQFEEYRQSRAKAVLDGLDKAERGRRLKAARSYLLNQHPDHNRFREMISDERYEEFYTHAEEQLIEDTLRTLQLPDFEVWKSSVVVKQPKGPAEKGLAGARSPRR